MGEIQPDVKRLADVAEKLLRETANLRRDVQKLAARFSPSEWTRPDATAGRPIATMKDALVAIGEARRNILNAERDLASTRSMVDIISGDVMSREEMKTWLIDPSRKRQDR